MTLEINHFYVFYVDKEGDNVYERTCGEERAAQKRVEELKKYHPDGFYLKNELPEKYFY